MINREGPVWAMYNEIKETIYSREQCNNGHDLEHIERMLAMRQAFWSDIVEEEVPEVQALNLALDSAILIHDFNRSRDLRGRDNEQRRIDLAHNLMAKHGIPKGTAQRAVDAVQATFGKDSPDEPPVVRLLRDFDKADMDAVGVYRMAAVATDRKYGIFARREDFDLEAQAIEGDENLDSFAADIKFCMDWWNNPKFQIRTPAIRKRVEHRFRFMSLFLAQLQTEMEELCLI